MGFSCCFTLTSLPLEFRWDSLSFPTIKITSRIFHPLGYNNRNSERQGPKLNSTLGCSPRTVRKDAPSSKYREEVIFREK